MEKDVDERLQSYKENEITLLSYITDILSAAKDSAQNKQPLLVRSLDVKTLCRGLQAGIEQFAAVLGPPRDVREELKAFLTALEWIQALYEVQSIGVVYKCVYVCCVLHVHMSPHGVTLCLCVLCLYLCVVEISASLGLIFCSIFSVSHRLHCAVHCDVLCCVVALLCYLEITQMLSVIRSEDLFAELTLLLQTGKNHLRGLSLPRHRNASTTSQQKLSTSNCCFFFRPIFEQYYQHADQIQTQLETFLMEAEALLDGEYFSVMAGERAVDQMEQEEQEEENEKASYSDVASLVQDATGTLEACGEFCCCYFYSADDSVIRVCC